MKKRTKSFISSVLTATLTVGALAGSLVTNAVADVRKVDVWDFGGVAESGDMYDNHITADQLDSLEFVADGGKFNVTPANTATDCDFGNDLIVVALQNDRMYYSVGAGTKSYGTLPAHASKAYDDGYTAGGEYYCNGTATSARRYIKLANCKAGDKLEMYTNTSNSNSGTVHLTDLTDTTVADRTADFIVGGSRCDFVVPADGDYKLWIDSAGKPIVNRVVRYPGVTVSGTIDLSGLDVGSYGLKMLNKTTNEETIVPVGSDGSFTTTLTPDYTYTAIMTDAVGYGFTNQTKTIKVDKSDCATGTLSGIKLVTEVKSTYKASGEISGFDADYDLTDLTLTLVPTAESMAETVEVTLDGTSFSSVLLEPDIDYTAVLGGVNDYKIVAGGVFNSNSDITQNIDVTLKELYNVSGSFEGLASDATVDGLVFVNMDDNYSYQALVKDGNYYIALRDGSYEIVASVNGYKTNTHVAVNGKAVTKNLLFVSTDTTVKSVDWTPDVYVGSNGGYSTVGEALTAIAGMGVDSEAKRVTVHIAPGTYREQLTVTTPYVTFKNDTTEPVVLTWYYGIGYQYYSADSTGFYNSENDYDKFAKNNASKWGCATYVKEAAKGFKADGITFETSFNKYVTDEEIADGVELNPPTDSTITTVRRISTDVTSRAATERATALAIEADDSEFRNCEFIGSQDTLYTGSKDYNLYFKDCIVEGSTDYIFGDGNCVFDNCVLRWCGYSDTAQAGYITAAKAVASKGYLFRNCTVAGKEDMKIAAGNFGRPWDAAARVIFQDTKLISSDYINSEGWASMSGKLPQDANYTEYNTTYGGTAVDTTGRVVAPVSERPVTDVTSYFGDWTPTYLTTEDGTPTFAEAPSLSSTGDINIPYTGETITAHYLLTDTDDDASQINWYLVNEAGEETLVAAGTAKENVTYTPSADAVGSKVKITVIPEYVSGVQGEAKSFVTESALKLGSESNVTVDTTRVGKVAVFLAGDSTVKDYSAGALNNSGKTRVEGSWGEYLQSFFNKKEVQVYDYAEGGESSQTFIYDSKKNFDKIAEKLQEGDYLFIQFGHNDCSETYSDRYVPLGTPDENGIYPITAPTDDEGGATVATRGTFKYYLNMYIELAKSKGATPVLVTPVSRLYYNADGTIRAHHDADSNTDKSNTYCTAVKQLGDETGTLVIDMFDVTKSLYEQTYADDTAATNGTSDLASRLFAPGEKTHNSKLGGFVLATKIAQLIKDSSLGIASKVISPASVDGIDNNGDNEFTVSTKGVLTAYDKDSSDSYTVVDDYWSGIANKALEALAGTTVTPPTVEETIYGDVDGDGTVTPSDAALAYSHVLKPETVGLTDEQKKLANVDGKEGITSADVANILQKALDSNFVMPVEE
jgi:pectin methylesterase-like acyl-CoA thioesterase/lysophospholipase L1-like esterase